MELLGPHQIRGVSRVHQIIECSVLEGLEGDTPLIGENRLTGRVDQNCVASKSLTHVEGPYRDLERHVINEHRRFCRRSRTHCTRFGNTCLHRIIVLSDAHI